MDNNRRYKLGDKVVYDGQSRKYKGRVGILTRELVGMWGLRIDGTELLVRDSKSRLCQPIMRLAKSLSKNYIWTTLCRMVTLMGVGLMLFSLALDYVQFAVLVKVIIAGCTMVVLGIWWTGWLD